MTKAQLLHMVLDQLLEHHKSSPESFEFVDPTGSTRNSIIWKPKVKSKVDPNGPALSIPMEPERTVIVMYESLNNTLQCHIGKHLIQRSDAEAKIEVKLGVFGFMRSDYGKFRKLVNLIEEYNKDKENNRFLEKILSVFPGALERHIFGEDDE